MNAVKQLGFDNTSKLFRQTWKAYGFHTMEKGREGLVTQSLQSWHRQMREAGAHERDVKDATEDRPGFKNFAARRLAQQAGEEPAKKVGPWDEGLVGEHTPLVFDPEVFQVLTEEAPALMEVPVVGQEGYKAVVRRIDDRDEPIGFMSEGDSLDLSNFNASQSDPKRLEEDETIWGDLVEVSDFSQEATAHDQGFAPLRETALGERLIEAAQNREKILLYGEPTTDHTERGSPYHEEGYPGLSTYSDRAGNTEDKSGVSSNFGEDIKAEMVELEQAGIGFNRSEALIFASHTMVDTLENEVEGRRRYAPESDEAVFGFPQVRIGGVPVIPTHNITPHTYGDGSGTEPSEITRGDEGDVFLTTRRATQIRALAPLMTVPLAKNGLSETVALTEFATAVERANGQHTKHLQGYAV